jgi:lipid A 3-O-deacylase
VIKTSRIASDFDVELQLGGAWFVTAINLLIPIVLALSVLLGPVAASAGQFSIYEENDTFGLDSPSDRHYSQGLRMEYSWHADSLFFLPRAITHLPQYKARPFGVVQALAIAQNMYTPEIITDPVYNPDDRPFAAWMYAAYKALVIDSFGEPSEWQDTYELSLGVVGPWAQGDEIQSWFHKVKGDPDDPTYVNQIPNQVVAMLSYSRKWSLWLNPPSTGETYDEQRWPMYLMPATSLRLGNAMTDVGLGVTFLAGFHTPVDFAAGSINPSVAGTANPGQFRLYAHAGIDGRFVMFNAFLDGTAFRESASIERNELVADYKLGITMSWRWFRGSFTQVWRTPEIETRSNYQNFGAIQLGFGTVSL